jgi:arylsulfatase A-like enzyme
MWNTTLRPGENTIATVLQRNGYRTGMVGKWHLGTKPDGGYLERPNLANADPEDPMVKKRMWAVYEQERAYVAETYGFEFVDALHVTNPEAFLGGDDFPEKLAVHNVDWMTDRALKFLDADDGRPFFLFYSTTVPHGPSTVKSMHSDPRYTMAGVLDEAPKGQPSRKDMFRRILLAELREPRPWQFMGMTWLDDGIGVLLEKIETMGATENTLVIVMSDHQSGGKYTLYEDGARVPCFANWPGRIPPGSRSSELVANIDIAATLVDVCGAHSTEYFPLDGRSWRPLFDGRHAGWREELFLEIAFARGVVTKDCKYIAVRYPNDVEARIENDDRRNYSWDGSRRILYGVAERFPAYFDSDQFYHVVGDPREKTNLVNHAEYAHRLADLRARLKLYLTTFPHHFGEFTLGTEGNSIR